MTEFGRQSVPVFDGHNDVAQRLAGRHGPPLDFFQRQEDGHLDLPRAREGGLVGGLFAVFVPDPEEQPEPDFGAAASSYEEPLPPPLDFEYAVASADRQLDLLTGLAAESEGAVALVRSLAELRRALDSGALAAVLHLEGAEAIDPGLERLEALYGRGLRSLGLVWSRPNAFGHGVPFKFPSTPDLGPGLTPAGRDLVRACNRLGVLIDLSHLNEAGFWDVAGLTDRPLVASHSNVNAICASSRNVTDKQLDAVAESHGVVGLNFAVAFIRPDGNRDPDTPLSELARHAAYVAERIGVEHLALGSDFDGATIPTELGDVSGLPRVLDSLRAVGFVERELRQVAAENWLRVLGATWR